MIDDRVPSSPCLISEGSDGQTTDHYISPFRSGGVGTTLDHELAFSTRIHKKCSLAAM
ncbi:hypothetical protein BDV25DRAFT_165443 [Aspergillus avenaceus]|uniref:Uncharacterized protein n=1 Tax=Aspergillus avenaceus TaxID=36643 RepID=A0A5N6TFD5_ASPAV|nr:hypothetical protein BDV25DRAFT_165443 [Aspergillus avenaceus]